MRRKKTADNDQIPEPESGKTRKAASGLIRDKARTKARMVAAVGKVIQQKGYTALTAHNIGLAAGVDKKLIWTHFGGINNLIEEYLNQKDFWRLIAKGRVVDMLKKSDTIGKNAINGLLQSQLEVLLKDKVLQKIIHWELGGGKDVLRTIADKREETGEEILSVIAPDFESVDVDIRARLALLVGGIYYLTLHAKGNGSTFCGIDLNEEEGKQRIGDAVRDLIFEAYEKAGIDK